MIFQQHWNLFLIGLLQVKWLKKLYTALYVSILYFNEDFGNVIFNCTGMDILNIDLNNINLDDNFDEDDPDTIILTRLLAWHIKFEKCNQLQKIMFKFFLWVIYTLGNIGAVSHIKTWYSSRCPNTTVYKIMPGGGYPNAPM